MPRKAATESVSDAHAAPGGAAAVDRALSLLAAFRAGDAALSLAELAERTRLYKSTVLRLLASLEHARLIQKLDDGPHPGSYALGAEVARLHGIYAASFSLDRVVLPVLRELVAQTGESAAYHVLQGQPPHLTRLCLYRVDSPHPIRDHIRAGDVLPADRGTGGRVLMAFNDALARTLPEKDRKVAAEIRARGYCASIGDRQAEVAGISAPVFRADGAIAAALTLTMPAHRYDERYVKPVLEAARALGGQ
jgi:DNA-binding IclR family transcriptional regulator